KLSSEDFSIISQTTEGKRVIAINKCDLVAEETAKDQLRPPPSVEVSAITEQGLAELTAAILAPFGVVDSEAVGLLITDSRHYDLLRRTQASLEKSAELFRRKASEEIVLVGLHSALQFLGEITGETTTDDILAQIF